MRVYGWMVDKSQMHKSCYWTGIGTCSHRKHILYPLIIEEEDPSHLARTISILSNAGTAIDSKVWLKGTTIKSNKFLVKYLLARPYHHVETATWPHDPPSDTQHRQPHGRQKLKQISLWPLCLLFLNWRVTFRGPSSPRTIWCSPIIHPLSCLYTSLYSELHWKRFARTTRLTDIWILLWLSLAMS